MRLLHHQVQVGRGADRERRGLDREHSDSAPPGQRASPEPVVRQTVEVEYEPGFHQPSRSMDSRGSGQNQPIRVMATGTAPMYSPQGVKIDNTNKNVAARAARNGQREGSA